jgi:hypothetical protein
MSVGSVSTGSGWGVVKLASNVDLGSTVLMVVVGETDATGMDELEHAIARSAKIAVMGARVITDLDRIMKGLCLGIHSW